MKNKNYFIKRTKCPVCSSKNISEIYSCNYQKNPIKSYLNNFYKNRLEWNYLQKAKYVLIQCNECEAIYQKYIPNTEFMKRIYEKWLSLKSIKASSRIDTKKKERIIQEISELKLILKKKHKLTFLDYGMGNGEWCLIAKTLGINIYGLELSQELLKKARKMGIKTITESGLRKISFNYINTDQVFEHIPNPLDTLKLLKSVLDKDGIVKISVPSGNHIPKYLRKENWDVTKSKKGSLNPISPLEHITCYTHKSIVIMGKTIGLKEIKIPLFIQYKCTQFIDNPKNISRKILKPVYLNYSNYSTYVFLKRTKNR